MEEGKVGGRQVKKRRDGRDNERVKQMKKK